MPHRLSQRHGDGLRHPARQAFIVDLVGKPDLPNAIALNSTLFFNFTRVLGPAVGGVIIAAVGMANCFILNAASFLAVILALALMKLPQAPKTTWKPFLHAWKEIAGLPLDPAGVAAGAVTHDPDGCFRYALSRPAPHVGQGYHGGRTPGLRPPMAASGLGAFLGGLTLARRPAATPAHAFVSGRSGPVFLGLVGLGLCGNYYAALVFIFVSGFGMVTQLSTGNSLLQLNVPDELRGRLMCLFGLSSWASPGGQHPLRGGAAHYTGPGPAHYRYSLIAALAAGPGAPALPGPAPLRFHRPGAAGGQVRAGVEPPAAPILRPSGASAAFRSLNEPKGYIAIKQITAAQNGRS